MAEPMCGTCQRTTQAAQRRSCEWNIVIRGAQSQAVKESQRNLGIRWSLTHWGGIGAGKQGQPSFACLISLGTGVRRHTWWHMCTWAVLSGTLGGLEVPAIACSNTGPQVKRWRIDNTQEGATVRGSFVMIEFEVRLRHICERYGRGCHFPPARCTNCEEFIDCKALGELDRQRTGHWETVQTHTFNLIRATDNLADSSCWCSI